MAAVGALAENQRRNERVDRGIVTVPSSGVATIVLGPMANASATFVLANPPGEIGMMRFITHFELTLDDGGTRFTGITAGSPAMVSGNINATAQTVGSFSYAAGTVLNVNVYAFTSTTDPQYTTPGVSSKVRFTVWGLLQPGGSPF